MKKYVFLRNKTFRPSSFYRVYQYIRDLEKSEIYISEYESNIYYKLNKYKNRLITYINKGIFMFFIGYLRRIFTLFIIINKRDNNYIFVQRSIFPRVIGPLGKLLLKRVIENAKRVCWEFDDNIIYSKEITEFERKLLEKNASKIIVGNKYLKEQISVKYKEKIEIVNTTDKEFLKFDVNKANKLRKSTYHNQFVIVWLGTDTNLEHLEPFINVLDRAMLDVDKEIILKVICNKRIEIKTEKLVIENIKWTRERAFDELYKCHMGLMPLKSNSFTKGKCAFKAIQYMGAALPIVISPVGMNKEIIVDNLNGLFIEDSKEFKDRLIDIVIDIEKWDEMSWNARKVWSNQFNPIEIENTLLTCLDL